MNARPLTDVRGWEALVHGVFAIALTLLVLDIRVPDAASIDSGAALVAALAAELPRYIAYVLGFVVLGEYWLHVQRTMAWMRGVDHVFLVLGLLFLMVIAAVPFVTALLAEYIGLGGGRDQVALAVFISWQLVLATVTNIEMHYAVRRGHLLKPSIAASGLRSWFVIAGLGPLIWLAALLAVFLVSGTVALLLTGAILVIFLFELPIRLPDGADADA
jgi:uncharacterized membrane protein